MGGDSIMVKGMLWMKVSGLGMEPAAANRSGAEPIG
jgi:hypothetical protein